MPTKETTLEQVLQPFKGKTPDQIADMIGGLGIKGRLGTTYGCPMALLLDGMHLGRFVIGRAWIARRAGSRIERRSTPENIKVFIRKIRSRTISDIDRSAA